MSKSNRASALLAAALLGGAATAQAEQIYIDMSDLLASPTGNWNTISAVNSTDSGLVDFVSGSATSVALTTAGWSIEFSSTSVWGPGSDKDWVQEVAAEDWFYGFFGGTATATVSGLTEAKYKVEVVVAGPVSERVDVTVDASFADRNFDGVGGVDGDDFNVRDDGGVPGNWLIWDEVTPTAGQFTIQIAAVTQLNGDRPHLNAIRITPAGQDGVPIPGWAALATGISLVIGSAWLLAKRPETGR